MENIKDIKKTWKDIKSIISMKSKNSDIPLPNLNNGKSITESRTTANLFNDFFSVLLHLQFNQNLSFLVNHLISSFKEM